MLKPSHIPTILELVLEGAKDRPVPLTTVELARRLGKSQQMASKHLEEMERAGLIERIRSRGTTYVKLTGVGVAEANQLYSNLQSAFGQKERMVEVQGSVFYGLGEATYYTSLNGYRKQFISKLGFDPFPGTLNIRLGSVLDRRIRRDLATSRGIHIDGFKDGKRSYGGAECFRAVLNDKIACAVLMLERTSYDDSVLEILAPVNLRKTLNLKEGGDVRVRIVLNGST